MAEQLGRAMTVEELRAAVDSDGFVATVVGVDLDDMVGVDLEHFLDNLSEWVTGSIAGLTDIGYKPVGVDGEQVLVEVTGCVEWDSI